MEFDGLLESTAFWVLTGVGIGAFAIMTIVLKKMGNGDIMPWWVQILTLLAIPVVAAFFSGWASGD